jgi:hypothetical protein
VPQDFPAPVISNLLTLTGFTQTERTRRATKPHSIDQTSALHFKSSDESRYLDIFPSEGWIDYHNEKAEARMTETVHGVPDEDEARRLALRYLPLLGIDRNQLAVRPGTSDIDAYGEKVTRTSHDKASTNLIAAVDSRGVFFNRRIDGLPIEGIGLHGGVRITFGNDAKIVYLQVVWRNLKPHEIHRVLSPDDILQRIRDGRIKLPRVGDFRTLRKLTVDKAELFYEGELGDETQKLAASYVRLQITADFGETKPTFYVRLSTKAD